MAVTLDFQGVSAGTGQRSKIRDAVSQALQWKSGRWHVQFIGERTGEIWEMRVSGPGVEASEYLNGALGEHSPEQIVAVLKRVTAG